jgi:FolB domain-containing protein
MKNSDYGKLLSIISLEQKRFPCNRFRTLFSQEEDSKPEHMDKVFITNLLIRAIIGVNDRERETPQDILVNVTIYTDIRPAARSDDIADCVDYADISKKIRALVEKVRRFTVEALAEDIAVLCLDNPRVRKVTVRVEKPKAVTGAESVGVEIERSKI